MSRPSLEKVQDWFIRVTTTSCLLDLWDVRQRSVTGLPSGTGWTGLPRITDPAIETQQTVNPGLRELNY